MTHPFHPLFGQQLSWVGERANSQGKRLLLQTDNGVIWPVPPQWTDLVSPDPEFTVSGGRALFLVSNLMELASLVERLCGGQPTRSGIDCKDDYAVTVSKITPQGMSNER
ncbi:hypothetical protein G6M50_06640 [Agrobacterium rhizogenes]|nr:hypothetical protein [Rhizobium rhizogenes]NTJ77479.1 hypothetical protein [Rhizobium rhizogenes]